MRVLPERKLNKLDSESIILRMTRRIQINKKIRTRVSRMKISEKEGKGSQYQ